MENKKQLEAIKHFLGPALVLAGPGSGKTYTLTNRIYNLIKEYKVNDNNILVVTFTKAAAKEMKERFYKLCEENSLMNYENVQFGTFHSIFFSILRDEYDYKTTSLLKYENKIILFKEVLEELVRKGKINNSYSSLDIEALKGMLNEFLSYKSHIQNFGDVYTKKLNVKSGGRDISQNKIFNIIYEKYYEVCKKNKYLDYDDMITLVLDFFKKDEKTLRKYQEIFQFILIDEFQDINLPQYNIMKLLCSSKNLFCVGDDDQSIYSFRGVRPEIMQTFVKEYKNCKIINLNINYRSTKDIIKYATNVITKNEVRFEKELIPIKDEKGILEAIEFSDYIAENVFVIKNIKQLHTLGISYNDMAVLYRTNNIPLTLIEDLKKENIPFIVKDKLFNIYETFYVKDVLAYLKVAINKYTKSDFYSIANKPCRYITRDSLNGDVSVANIKQHYKNVSYMQKILNKLEKDLNRIAILPTASSIEYIRKILGYEKYIEEYCNNKNIKINEIIENLDYLENEAVRFPKISEFIEHCSEESMYLSDISNNDDEKENTKNEDTVKLMTFHASKGLEFYDVQIIDTNDGIIPHKKSIKDNDIDSERRLFYVALTRAKVNLHILFTKNRYARKQEKSRFIMEGVK